MPHKCCVPGCKGNYLTRPKVSVFGFPKQQEQQRMWLNAIKRENSDPGPTSKDTPPLKSSSHQQNQVISCVRGLQLALNALEGKCAQLSGGQKQRIAIARAIVRNPSILLLDEATSALDVNSEAKVQAALDSASKNCTTIIVAHRLSTIRNADKIIVIRHGTVVEQGTHSELMRLGGDYHTLVTSQVQSSDAIEIARSFEKTRPEEVENMEEEEEKNIPQLSDSEEKDTYVQKASLWSITKMNTPEWPYLLIGSIGAAAMGSMFPIFALLFGTIMQMYMFSVAGHKLTLRLRSQMYEAILRQEMGYFDRKSNGVGALCAQLASEASYVQGATGQRIGALVNSTSTFILGISLAMYYQWKLGLVALSFFPLIVVAQFFTSRQMMGENDKFKNALQTSSKIAVEAVSNVRTVVSLGCEDLFHDQYVRELTLYVKKSVASTHGRSVVLGMARAMQFFAFATCMYYGGKLIKRDGVPYGDIFKVSQALIMGTMSIAQSLAFTPNLEKGIEAAKNVMNLLNRVPKIKNKHGAQNKFTSDGNINYSKVNFSYPTRENVKVLKDLDLIVQQAKTVALVGASGCGKSTIVQLIERFYDSTSGNVLLDEENIKDISLSSLRSHLGIVAQEPNLFSMTIGENIAYGDNSRYVTQSEILEAAKKANIHNFITSLPLGYDTKLGEKGTQLSGGQKQRIAIARALIRNPRVLLLDEATSALDTESEKIVQDALDNARQERTCITIAHRLSTIQDADLICVINDGKVAESGTHEDLIAMKGLYYKLQTIQGK